MAKDNLDNPINEPTAAASVAPLPLTASDVTPVSAPKAVEGAELAPLAVTTPAVDVNKTTTVSKPVTVAEVEPRPALVVAEKSTTVEQPPVKEAVGLVLEPSAPEAAVTTAALVEANTVVDATAPAITFAAPDLPPVTVPVGEIPQVVQFVFDLVDEYVAKMRPGKSVSPDEGRVNQRSLLRVYRQVLGLDDSDFVIGFNALLSRINDHRKGTFSEAYVFRFLSEAAFEESAGKFFQTFTTLCMQICEPSSRSLTIQHQINQTPVLDRLMNEEQRNRLHGYLQSYSN